MHSATSEMVFSGLNLVLFSHVYVSMVNVWKVGGVHYFDLRNQKDPSV